MDRDESHRFNLFAFFCHMNDVRHMIIGMVSKKILIPVCRTETAKFLFEDNFLYYEIPLPPHLFSGVLFVTVHNTIV